MVRRRIIRARAAPRPVAVGTGARRSDRLRRHCRTLSFVIVVVGNPVVRAPELGGGPAGPAVLAALAAAGAGSRVELVGKAGDDARGDDLLLALGRGGVGHVAVLRDAAHPTPVLTRHASSDRRSPALEPDDDVVSIEPSDPSARPGLDAADVQLALRYLPDYRVLLVAEPQSDEIVSVIADAAAYAGATLVVTVDRGWQGTTPDGALVVEADTTDPESRLAELLGAVAWRIEHGATPDHALREVMAQQT